MSGPSQRSRQTDTPSKATAPSPAADEHDAGRWLTPGVAGIGAASLCSDASHELMTSLLSSFLTSTLHAGPAALGLIEGVSDALTGPAKLIGGPLDTDPGRRGRFAASGSLGTSLATEATVVARFGSVDDAPVVERTRCWNEIRRRDDQWMVTLVDQHPPSGTTQQGADR